MLSKSQAQLRRAAVAPKVVNLVATAAIRRAEPRTTEAFVSRFATSTTSLMMAKIAKGMFQLVVSSRQTFDSVTVK
jgi:hypothetical protein